MTREPIFNVPSVIVALILGLAALHGLREYWLDDSQDAQLLLSLAFVPGRFTYAFDPAGVADVFASFQGPLGRAQEETARFLLGDGQPLWWTTVSYALLHADWMHLGVNCLWLAAFGAPVARRFGTWRFLALMGLGSLGGAALHYATHRYDLMPVIGASASVSAAIGAAVRFVFQPGAPLGGIAGDSFHQPAQSLRHVFTSSRTLPFLLIWFAVNLVFGLISAPLGITDGPVAWEAHVGGFAAGLLLFPLLDPAISTLHPSSWDQHDEVA